LIIVPAVINDRMSKRARVGFAALTASIASVVMMSAHLVVAIARLGREPDGGVGGSVGPVAAALDYLEEKTLGERS
jgi:hypothetical protein